jgi:hypothetical protein
MVVPRYLQAHGGQKDFVIAEIGPANCLMSRRCDLRER